MLLADKHSLSADKAISTGLDILQVNKLKGENDSQTLMQALFVARKLAAVCSACVLTSNTSITLHTSISHMYINSIAFSVRLNILQVDQVNRENDTLLLLTHHYMR